MHEQRELRRREDSFRVSTRNPEIYRCGNTYVEGFSNPKHDLVYICNKETAGEHGFVILSIEQLGAIITAHQKRLREDRRITPADYIK